MSTFLLPEHFVALVLAMSQRKTDVIECLACNIALNGIPIYHTRKARKTDDRCAICFEEMEGEVALLRCKHVYHTACIDRWFAKERSCPICRTMW
jgi:ribosomal protein L34E